VFSFVFRRSLNENPNQYFRQISQAFISDSGVQQTNIEVRRAKLLQAARSITAKHSKLNGEDP
jgi:hypothetical protein